MKSTARPQSRGQWGVLAFVLVALAAIAAVLLLMVQGGETSEEPYSVRSNAPSGLLGLRLWLQDMGYDVQVTPSLGADQGVALVFPGATLTPVDRTRMRQWVEAGGTLVVANVSGEGLFSTLGVIVQTQQTYADVKLLTVQPVLSSSGNQYGRASGRAVSASSPEAKIVPVVKTEHGDTAVLLQTLGKGSAWHIGSTGALTNADLRQGWGREFVVAALRGKPAGSTVYIINGEIEGPNDRPVRAGDAAADGLWAWTLRHPVGWAALLLAALVLIYLFTQGRRLGPPVVVSDPHRRRAAVEHIEALASLAQRAGHFAGIAHYQKGRLKRGLGQAWRVGAGLDDAAFVAGLTEQARLSPQQAHELADLLAKLDAVKDESALVGLVAQAERFNLEA